MTFQRYVAALIRRYGTADAVAGLIDMSAAAFARAVRDRGTLGVGKVLRLAEAVGDPPSYVLRLADKGDVADLIERLYGPPRKPLSDEDRALIALPPAVKVQVLGLVKMSARAKS